MNCQDPKMQRTMNGCNSEQNVSSETLGTCEGFRYCLAARPLARLHGEGITLIPVVQAGCTGQDKRKIGRWLHTPASRKIGYLRHVLLYHTLGMMHLYRASTLDQHASISQQPLFLSSRTGSTYHISCYKTQSHRTLTIFHIPADPCTSSVPKPSQPPFGASVQP